MKNIYLSGFMACGKSTVGKTLAKKLGRPHRDTDKLIEEASGMRISEIFLNLGESAFRKMETDLLKKIAQESGLIVSLGGGVILDPENRKLLRNGEWIFLDVPFTTLSERLKRSKHRPLAKTSPEELRTRYDLRLPFYREAKHIIDCSTTSIEDVCLAILKAVKS